MADKDKTIFLVLHFACHLRVPMDVAKSWIQLISWAIECDVALNEYIVVNLENRKDDKVNFTLHYIMLPFDIIECEMTSLQTGQLDLANKIMHYALNDFWTRKMLDILLNNVTKVKKCQTICVTMQNPQLPITKKNWEGNSILLTCNKAWLQQKYC